MSAHADAVTARMPPGPRLPRFVQTLGFMLGGPRFVDACQRRYGSAVTLGTLFDSRFVLIFDPALVKQLFQGSAEQLHAGEANALLGPIVGARSVLLLDGAEHLRHRRLLLPAFHGRQIQSLEEVVLRAADAEIDAWPVGREFTLAPSMRTLTMRVILEAVFGYEPGDAEAELAASLREFIEPLAQPRSLRAISGAVRNRLAGRHPLGPVRESRLQVDEILFTEIARRRRLPEEELAERGDVFSGLLLARDEQGRRLTDEEVRDELLTLLLAGHETTATGLAWAFDLLLHTPAALERARRLDDAYLDAVVKESLRIRPVIPGVGRIVSGAPFELGEWTIPPGVEINPAIRLIHARPDLYPNPGTFRPERFLSDDAPDTYTWLPFGGGTRRCLGASFALMEMRLVLRRVLERAQLRPARPNLEPSQFRVITLAPKGGVAVLLQGPPAPVGLVHTLSATTASAGDGGA